MLSRLCGSLMQPSRPLCKRKLMSPVAAAECAEPGRGSAEQPRGLPLHLLQASVSASTSQLPCLEGVDAQVAEERLDRISQMTKSFFRRPLPDNLTSFTSVAGKTLFKEALEGGTLANYFDLAGNFTTQTETAYCGLGSLAMVLNALEMDPGRVWKGVWRWYSDDMLECCSPLDEIKAKGITFDQFTCLAACHELEVEDVRHELTDKGDPAGYARFLGHLRATAQQAGLHMVVSFARPVLQQTGVGHFSPVGGYHAATNQVLVLDVARFKYPSYWVDAELLWRAMAPIDLDTGLPRGYHLLRNQAPRPQ